MDIKNVLKELDNLFATSQYEKAGVFICDSLKKADEEGDFGAGLSLLNELMGYYREFTRFDKLKEAVNETIRRIGIMDEQNADVKAVEMREAKATSMQNIANAYRAMGDFSKSYEYYEKTREIYREILSADDFRFASLYNNMSLLFQAQNEPKRACESLNAALEIVKMHPEARNELAITYTNLGQAYIGLSDYENAKNSLKCAEEIFAEDGKCDYHYSGCANALGQLYMCIGDYENSVKYYEEALYNMHSTVGKTKNYKTIRENLMMAYNKAGYEKYDSMLDVCQAYYEKYGKPMLTEKFPAYVDKIAVGLSGEGSECFGFEDEISTDHDCGPGFAMWMTDEVFEQIGGKLNEEYEKLPKVFAGYVRNETEFGTGRCGAQSIDGFFERVLGGREIPKNDSKWRAIEEYGLAAAVNGKVFVDSLGEFTKKREYLQNYYPEEIWLEKMARVLMKCAQTGQYNYGRCMAREEYVTAQIVLGEYMQNIMQLVFLLNKKYASYYKWQHKAMANLEVLPEIGDILNAICDMPSQRQAWKDYQYDGNVNSNDMIAMTIEIIAKLVVDHLQTMGLSKSNDTYLEAQAREVLKHLNFIKSGDRKVRHKELNKMIKTEKVDLIVKMEWEAFDQVQNEGGRASCQDDWETFSIMRKSQYLTWNEEMLDTFIEYFDECMKAGRNLITEKYGRMMESTVPWEYERIKDAFPVLSDEHKAIQEEIIKIQVVWMEEFAKEYPNLAANSRSIRTNEDTAFNTSYETYLRGELGTYSDEMLMLYGRFIAELAKTGKNLAKLTMENTVKMYGYDNLDLAESSNTH